MKKLNTTTQDLLMHRRKLNQLHELLVKQRVSRFNDGKTISLLYKTGNRKKLSAYSGFTNPVLAGWTKKSTKPIATKNFSVTPTLKKKLPEIYPQNKFARSIQIHCPRIKTLPTKSDSGEIYSFHI